MPPSVAPTSIWEIILEALDDFTIQLLLVAAVISLIVGISDDPDEGWFEGVSILFAVLIVVSVASTQDYLKELQFRKLNSEVKRLKISVLRDDILKEVPSDKVVVGDLVYLSPGEFVPADGILVRSFELLVDESAMTGESKPVKKGVNDPFLLSSAVISEGSGEMIICAVGKKSNMGKSQKLITQTCTDEITPLQIKLERVAKLIGIVGFIAAFIIFAFLAFVEIEESISSGDGWTSDNTSDMLTAFILAVTVLVVAIPEGLPLAVTLSLAFSMRKMKQENIFVKHLSACETMGGCEELLCDKTGTLTKNEMSVIKFNLGCKKVNLNVAEIDSKLIDIISSSIARNTTADVNSVDGVYEKVGSRTECALLMFLVRWGINYHRFRNVGSLAMQIPFSSDSKKMTTFHIEGNNRGMLYLKGAPERVFDKCKYYFKPDGTIEEFTPEILHCFEQKLQSWSKKILRTVAVAYKQGTPQVLELSSSPNKEEIEKAERDMILIGIFGIADPIRDESREAIEILRKTGVTVRMITGDNRDIAMRIGKHCSLLPEGYSLDANSDEILLGKEFDTRVGGLQSTQNVEGVVYKVGNLDEFKKIEVRMKILARCTPQDKLLCTVGMRNLDRVVAVTGDGTNDAPALQRADIGIAMMTATPLAKESADIILLDDNIQSIVTAVKWGRNIYMNIRRFLQFQLTVNIVALLLCIIGAVTVASSPLTAVQMLWVNLLMDSLAALALSTQDPDKKVLESKPYGKNDNIISPEIIFAIIFQSAFQITILILILFLTPDVYDINSGWDSDVPNLHYTLFFNIFVMMQLFNQINCRKIRKDDLNVFEGIWNNKLFVLIIVIEFVFQILFIELGGDFMDTKSLTFLEFLFCVAVGFSTIIWGFFTKLMMIIAFK